MGPDRQDPPLTDRAWLLALARRMGGAGAEEDLVQEALLAAHAGPPPRGCARAFLAAILRNLVRQFRRGAARRRRREHRAARGETLPATDALCSAAERRRVLDEAVGGLREPYRSTVRLHFFDALSCAEIARRERVSSSTVRNRLRRALTQLRERLDGGGLLLAPLFALLRPRWAKVAAAGVLLSGAAAWASAAEPEDEPAPPPPPPVASPPAAEPVMRNPA